MKQVGITIIVAVLLSTGALAQSIDKAKLQSLDQLNTLGIKPASHPFSLIDLSRLRWSHSYSLSYFSGNGGSGSVGLLNSMLMYDISSKLTLGVNLSMAHNLAGSWNTATGTQSVTFYPGFWLDYHPSEKFKMSIQVQKVPATMMPYRMVPSP